MKAVAADGLNSPLRALCRITAYAGLTLVLIPVQVVAILLRIPLRTTLPQWYHRRCCRLLGIRVERRGRQSRRHPTLFLANHTSYLDIAILGSLIQGSFVAKTDVVAWPFFGWLARLQRSVLIDRHANRAAAHRDSLVERLQSGGNLILFPEGTSGDGNRVLPFKSSLLAAAEVRPGGQPLAVQPVSLAYTRLDGVPLGRSLRPFFAWYGDMELAGHLWHALGLGYLTVVVRFHPPVSLADFDSCKALSDHCYEVISRSVADALAGRRESAARKDEAAEPKPAAGETSGAPGPDETAADPAAG